jgi:hypothetical protein
MAVQNYLLRPVQYSAAQWDGTNVTDINAVCQLVAWAFTSENGGTAYTPFGGSFTVNTGTYAVAGNGSVQFLTAEGFAKQYVAGLSWVVAP